MKNLRSLSCAQQTMKQREKIAEDFRQRMLGGMARLRKSELATVLIAGRGRVLEYIRDGSAGLLALQHPDLWEESFAACRTR